MDIELRREVRARMTELEDRVTRLEAAQNPTSEPDPMPEPVAPSPLKKSAVDATPADSAS